VKRGVEIAERLRLAVANAHPGGLDITISLGVAAAKGDEVRFAPLFAEADLALYEAKHSGRNRVSTSPVPTSDDPIVLSTA
jgi:diguanylate cyclase (GGDEF)-like protein